MKLLGIDTETTGLDVKIDEVTEVGLVLFDTDAHQPVRMTGCLVKTTLGITAEITKITGITQQMVDTYGLPATSVLKGILSLAKDADFFVAHNAEFDRGMLQAWCTRENMQLPALPWIDTRTDLPPAAYARGKSASLKYMACDHGFLYPAHRAMNDVLAMFQLLDMYDIAEIVKRAQTPNIVARAVVSYDDRLLAKEAGFFWVPDRKRWEIKLKADELVALKERVSFPVVQTDIQ